MFSYVFSYNLGLWKGEKNWTSFDRLIDDAKPKMFQPRSTPFVLKPKTETELNKLEKSGVISKVKFNLWGTSIVPTVKLSRDITICGNYKVTVNSFFKLVRAELKNY